jgi:hypothetical protein
MPKTGRSSYPTTDVVPYGLGNRRLSPPPSLSEREKAHFLDLVLGCPSSQFERSDLPLLIRWSELAAMAEEAAEHLRTEDLVVDGKVNAWFTIHQMATKSMSGLALRLKVSPQARSPKAPKTRPTPTSFYDRMYAEDIDGKVDEGRS